MYAFKVRIKKILSKLWNLIPQNQDLKSIPVLCYHSVNEIWDDNIKPMKPSRFEEHMDFLKKCYRPISLSDWMDTILHEKPLPKDAVLITFDDGYLDNYENIFPSIVAKNIPICIFVVTEFVKGNIKLVENDAFKAMSKNQIIKMRDSGLVSFGAHTSNHYVLSKLTKDEIYSEVNKSINDLNNLLGYTTEAFAYPFGQYGHIGKAGIDIVKNSSAVAAFSTHWGSSNSKCNHFFMPRMMVNSSDTVQDLSDKLQGKYSYLSLYHGFHSIFRALLEKLSI